MSDQDLYRAGVGKSSPDDFDTLMTGFPDWLVSQGYAAGTIKTCLQATNRFATFLRAQDVALPDFAPKRFETLKCAALECGALAERDRYTVSCLRRYFVEAGAAPSVDPVSAALTEREVLRTAYADYLRDERGLQPTTMARSLEMYENFTTFHFGEGVGDLATVNAENLAAFMLSKRTRDGKRVQREVPSHLRTFLRFLYCTGRIERDIARSLPRLGSAKPGRIPRYLPPEDVTKLLDIVRERDPLARRNYAMLLLMARLGLRAPEVVKIRLEDIDWRAGELLVRGKGGYLDRMPLPKDVGTAIVEYLHHDRKGSSRSLFVSSRAPFKPFTGGEIVRYILERAYEWTGIKPPQARVGSSILRHSLATDLLQKGASLEEVGDVLRHRSPMTTTIYARHGLDALRSVARDWPMEGGAQ